MAAASKSVFVHYLLLINPPDATLKKKGIDQGEEYRIMGQVRHVHPLGIKTLKEYQEAYNSKQKDQLPAGLAPLTKSKQYQGKDLEFPSEGDYLVNFKLAVLEAYVDVLQKEKLGLGPFGDVISGEIVKAGDGKLWATHRVARQAFYEIGQACDAVTIYRTVEDGKERIYTSLGIRGKEPNIGLRAFNGGFVANKPGVGITSEANTATAELRQESGVHIIPHNQADFDNLDCKHAKADLMLKEGDPGHRVEKYRFLAEFDRVGIVETDPAPMPQGGEGIVGADDTRVQKTTVFGIFSNCEGIRGEDINRCLRAGSDALSKELIDITDIVAASDTLEHAEAEVRKAFPAGQVDENGKPLGFAFKHHYLVGAKAFVYAHEKLKEFHAAEKEAASQAPAEKEATSEAPAEEAQGLCAWVGSTVCGFFIGIKDWIFSWFTCFAGNTEKITKA